MTSHSCADLRADSGDVRQIRPVHRDRTSTGRDGTQDTVRDRLDVTAAATRLGLSVEGVRKRIQRGQLAAEKQDGRWYVILPVQDAVPDNQDTPPDTSSTAPDNGISDLVRLVEKQQRDLIELAGRCGWLQSENQRLTETIRQLQALASAIADTPPASTSYGSAEGENGPRFDVQTTTSAAIAAEVSDPSRESPEMPSGRENSQHTPWWRFWQR